MPDHHPPHISGIQFDRKHLQVWVDGLPRLRRLTAIETRFFLLLASRCGEVCPRRETVLSIYGTIYDSKVDDGRLDAMVGRIRYKIEDNARSPRFLHTIHGIGHRLEEYVGEI